MAKWNEDLHRIASHCAEFEETAQCCVWYSVVHVFGNSRRLTEHVFTHLVAQTATVDRPSDIDRALELILPISLDEHQLHLVWSRRGDPYVKTALERFKGLLNRLHRIVRGIPKGVLVPPTVCARPDADEERLLRWGLSLIQISDWDQWVLGHTLHYAPSNQAFQEDGQVSPWELFESLDRFNPIPFVSRVSKATEDWSYWMQKHEEDNRKFPEVLAVSLTRNLFFATLYAVEKLGGVTSDRPQPRRRARRKDTFGTLELTMLDLEILNILIKHHRDGKSCEPLLQRQIILRLQKTVDKTAVVRSIKKLFGGLCTAKQRVMMEYRGFCNQNTIAEKLEIIMESMDPRAREISGVNVDDVSWDSDETDDDDGNDE